MTNTAEFHKELGNAHFRNQEYSDAITEYTKAILKDPSSNPVYYSNRAICHYKLGNYEATLADSEKTLELDKNSCIYYLGLAQYSLDRLSQAEKNLKKAYDYAIEHSSPSATAICQVLLDLHKKKWEKEEQARVLRSSPLLTELAELLNEKKEQARAQAFKELQGSELAEELEYLDKEHDDKIRDLSETFQRAGVVSKSTEVPSYLLDPISFNLFVDPVISKSGQSFERSWILQHLAKSETDPFSRQPLKKEDLIPNIQLKDAAQDFIAREGSF